MPWQRPEPFANLVFPALHGLTGTPHLLRSLLPWGALLTGLGIGLVCTNPGPLAFEEYAGSRLSALLIRELCRQDSLPLMLRLVMNDCPTLVDSQRPLLGRLAARHSLRRNLVLFSLYSTEVGGGIAFGRWQLPRYGSLTLGVAGQFLVLRASDLSLAGDGARQAGLSGGVW